MKIRNDKGQVISEVGIGEMAMETGEAFLAIVASATVVFGGAYLLVKGVVWGAEKTVNGFERLFLDEEEAAKRRELRKQQKAERERVDRAMHASLRHASGKPHLHVGDGDGLSTQQKVDALADELVDMGENLQKVTEELNRAAAEAKAASKTQPAAATG